MPMIYYKIVIEQIQHRNAAVAQSVERRIGSAEVTGPIPVSSLAVEEVLCMRCKTFFVSIRDVKGFREWEEGKNGCSFH